jgi:predicted kinase
VPEEERTRARKNAESFYKLALKYALFGSRPAVVVVFGVIGTGKSTIAKALSEELSFDVITSDIVRKRISGIPKYERKFEGYSAGIYSSDVTEKTYSEIFDSAEDVIENGKSVIIDASFSKKKWRDRLIERITKMNSSLYFIQTEAPKNLIEQRLLSREKEQKTISDARLEILDRFISDYEQPAEINSEMLIKIDTSKPVLDNVRCVFNELLKRNHNLF